jgi:hypothetical protein
MLTFRPSFCGANSRSCDLDLRSAIQSGLIDAGVPAAESPTK